MMDKFGDLSRRLVICALALVLVTLGVPTPAGAAGPSAALTAELQGSSGGGSPRDMVAIAAGTRHTIGVRADGTCVAVGSNEYFGYGSEGPCEVGGWTDIVTVAGGAMHTVGLKSNGTCVAVGNWEFGQVAVGGWIDITAVAAGWLHSVGLKSDGTCVAAGIDWIPENPHRLYDISDWAGIVAVAAGGYHTVGLRSDGACVADGGNADLQCNVTEWSDIAAISAGDRHTAGVRTDGTVVATGDNSSGQCNVEGWQDVVSVAAGGQHTVGLKADGTCVAVGDNGSRQCEVSAWTDIVAIAAGQYHTVGLRADGTCVETGDNQSGQCDVSGWGAQNGWDVTRITYNGSDDVYPQVSGDRVVWYGPDGSDTPDEVYTWTPGDTAPTNISNRDGLQDWNPQVSGDRVVWQGWDGNDQEVYTWTVGDAAPTNISNSDGLDEWHPQVSGDRVVWQGGVANDREIYTWAVGDAVPTNISNRDGLEDNNPQVSGDRVVWWGWDGNDYEIYTWSVGDAAPTNISNRDGLVDRYPQISGDRVVWEGDDGDDYEIYTWTDGDASPTNISNRDGLYDSRAQVSGDRVVWNGGHAEDIVSDVYTWRVGDAAPLCIPGSLVGEYVEPRISGDRVVWYGWQVYTWAVGDAAPTNVSNSSRYGEHPQISGDRVVWRASDGNDGEIYTAVRANAAPVASPDTYSTPYNTPLTVAAPGVLANDTDPDGDDLTAHLDEEVTKGTLVLNEDGSFTYTPNDGFVGAALFAYVASDGSRYSPAALVTITVGTPNPPPITYPFTSIAGANRYATAVEVSKKAFPDGADWVVIATGENWPDALGGASLAGALDGPILLTKKAALPSEVLAELTRLKADKAVILGSTAAVSASVESALKTALGPANVTRLGGANRYDTARVIAAEAVKLLKAAPGGYDGTAFVATGGNFPDALGASPLAAAKGWPIYLVNPATGADGALVSAMKSAGVTKAIVLGSTRAVSGRSEATIGSGVPCATDRLQGSNRYDTAVAVAAYGVANAGLGWNRLAIATGTNFPDALAGGVMQGRDASVLLLTPGTSLNASVASTLTLNKATIHEVRFLGSPAALSNAVRAQVANALK